METSSSPLITSIGATTADEMEGKRGGQTVSSRFTQQLRELVSMLDATGLHFVRCIKPNAKLSAGSFTSELVLQQLRCCGVLEVARVSRAGFPTRYRHADFVQRYKILLPREQQGMVLHNDAETRAAVVQLLAAFRVPSGQYEMGRTKVFFKPGALLLLLDVQHKGEPDRTESRTCVLTCCLCEWFVVNTGLRST
jgi:myosin-5